MTQAIFLMYILGLVWIATTDTRRKSTQHIANRSRAPQVTFGPHHFARVTKGKIADDCAHVFGKGGRGGYTHLRVSASEVNE
jgi:hypothetical protein